MKPDQFLTLLKVPEILAGKPVTAERRERAMYARLIGLGFGVDCSRCGGSGNYSYNAIKGTVCFKCDGLRYEAPKLTRELFERVERAVSAGELDTYLANVREKIAAEKAAKGAVDAIFKAWDAYNLSAVYSWRSDAPFDNEIANSVNLPMHSAYKRVSEISKKVSSLAWRLNGGGRGSKPLTSEQRAALEAERTQALADLITARDEGLKTIADAGALIPIIRAKYGV